MKKQENEYSCSGYQGLFYFQIKKFWIEVGRPKSMNAVDEAEKFLMVMLYC